jgi:hypothetical protein
MSNKTRRQLRQHVNVLATQASIQQASGYTSSARRLLREAARELLRKPRRPQRRRPRRARR